MSTALVTAIGSFSADIVIKKLKAMGQRVVGCDIYPRELVVDAGATDVFYQAPKTSHEQEYAQFIEGVCTQERVDYILPLTDIDVDFFNAHRAQDGSFAHALVCISPAFALSYCRDKDAMARFLETSASGIQGIQTALLADMDAVPVRFPVVVKPTDGRSSQGLMYVHNQREWEEVCKTADRISTIVQPYVEGRVVCVDIVRAADGRVCAAVPRREYLRTLNGAGTSVEVFHNASLQEACIKLAHELGVVGCVNFEFIEEDPQGVGACHLTGDNNLPLEKYHFLECNPRFAGGVEFSCIAAYDCITNHMHAYQGKPLDMPVAYKAQFIARKYEEYVTKVED
ncbi:MAG: ATP-grasp domain-containing protein [Atopobiaceae bacterium]|jgi:carbamoyl-phosphate synthase large subunit